MYGYFEFCVLIILLIINDKFWQEKFLNPGSGIWCYKKLIDNNQNPDYMKKPLLLILTVFIAISVTGQPPELLTRMDELIKPKKPEKEGEFISIKRTLERLQLQSPGRPQTSRLKSQQDYKKQLDSIYVESAGILDQQVNLSEKVEFLYDEEDRFYKEISYRWDQDEEEWIPDWMDEYLYNADGFLEKELWWEWNEGWDDWILIEQTEIFYDNMWFITEVISSDVYENVFTPYMKIEFYWEGENIVEQITSYYDPDNEKWDEDFRSLYTYENGTLIEENFYDWDYIEEIWVLNYRVTYHYDEDGNLDETFHYDTQEDLEWKSKYYYDEKGYPVEVVYSINETGEWEIYYKQAFSYDDEYNLIEESSYYFDEEAADEQWIPFDRYEYAFDYTYKFEETLVPYGLYRDNFKNMLVEQSHYMDIGMGMLLQHRSTLYYSDYEPSGDPDPDTYTLSIDIVGNGTVEVNGEPYTAAVTVDEGTELNLEAIAGEGWEFEGWSGDLTSTSATEAITMNSNRNITATFTEVTVEQYTLTVTIEGNGTVEVNGEPYTEAVTVDEGTELNLEAIADEGWEFEGWNGDLTSTSATEVITMNSNMNITATFILVSSAESMFPGELEIFPNPFSTSITLNNIQGYSRLLITNIIGKTVRDIQITGYETTTIPTDDLNNGIYLLILQAEDGERVVRKMVKD